MKSWQKLSKVLVESWEFLGISSKDNELLRFDEEFVVFRGGRFVDGSGWSLSEFILALPALRALVQLALVLVRSW